MVSLFDKIISLQLWNHAQYYLNLPSIGWSKCEWLLTVDIGLMRLKRLVRCTDYKKTLAKCLLRIVALTVVNIRQIYASGFFAVLCPDPTPEKRVWWPFAHSVGFITKFIVYVHVQKTWNDILICLSLCKVAKLFITMKCVFCNVLLKISPQEAINIPRNWLNFTRPSPLGRH